MHTVIYPKSRTTRQLAKRVTTYHDGVENGFTTQPAGTEELYYEVSLDQSGLDMMARQAAGNKSSMCNDGPLRVRIIERRKI